MSLNGASFSEAGPSEGNKCASLRVCVAKAARQGRGKVVVTFVAVESELCDGEVHMATMQCPSSLILHDAGICILGPSLLSDSSLHAPRGFCSVGFVGVKARCCFLGDR